MTKKTKNIFWISVATSVFTVSAAGLFFYEIQKKSQVLDEQVRIVTENNAKESTYLRLKRLAQETEGDRAGLSKHFFKNEGDSISFLGEVETLAAQNGLALKTEALDKVVNKDNSEYIKVAFSYEGKKETVLNFSRLMELLPYHSRVESLKVNQEVGSNWRGQITIHITIDTL